VYGQTHDGETFLVQEAGVGTPKGQVSRIVSVELSARAMRLMIW
jgi:hypothetical protein